jgi:DNA-binding transcriptional LysR family regulator
LPPSRRRTASPCSTGSQPACARRPPAKRSSSAARPIDNAILKIRQNILGQDLKLAGAIRLTTTDSFADEILVAPLRVFRARHPEITRDLLITNPLLDLLRLDADLSIRPSRNPPKQLTGRNVARMAFAACASKDGANARPEPFASDAVWIGIHHDLANSPVFACMAEIKRRNPIAARANSFVAARELAAAGLGFAILPCFLADNDPRLGRITPPISEFDMSVWVLTPGNLGRSARVRALSDHLVRHLKKRERLFAGDRD